MARRFQRQLAKTTSMPWLLATGEDFRYPGTEGGRPSRLTRAMHWYMDRLLRLCADQRDIYVAFAHLIHMPESPNALFQPSFVARALAYREAPAASQPRSPYVQESGS